MNLTEMLSVLFIIVLILLSYLLPFFHLRRWKELSSVEAAALSIGASSLLFGGVAFATHAIGVDQRLIHGIILALLAISIVPVLPRAFVHLAEAKSWPASFFLLFLALMLILQCVFPIYVGGFWYFDWWQHYNLSQMYIGKVSHDSMWLGMYNFASRTPLMNLNAAFFLSLFGDEFWLFQIVSSILSSAFIFPAFLLCERLAGRKKAVLIGALLFLSPSLVHNAWYPWPKLFAAYFVLLAAYFYIKNRREDHVPENVTCALVFGLIWAGFLAHQSSLFSSIVILLDLFFRVLRREPRRILPLSIACALCFVVINGVWFAWAMSFFGIKGSLLAYYERPASVGGISGYVALLTYHTLTTICSPLFVYDFFGNRFEALRFFENIQVLYYNSIAGLGTVTVFVAALVLLAKRITTGQAGPDYARYTRSNAVKYPLLLATVWTFALAVTVLLLPDFGHEFFSRYFNHPLFARKMFVALFLAGSLVLAAIGIFLILSARKKPIAIQESSSSLLFWMAVAGYAGGIVTIHELYIHGIISASCASSVLLTILLLGRISSDLSRTWRILLAIPIFFENLLIIWFPLLIIRYNWGWADEKNWPLKEGNSLVFMADVLPDTFWLLAFGGIAIQAAMLLVWIFYGKEEQDEHDSAQRT